MQTHIISILRDIKLVSRNKSVDLAESYYVRQRCLNVSNMIISAYDKFLWCDVTSLIYYRNWDWQSIKGKLQQTDRWWGFFLIKGEL